MRGRNKLLFQQFRAHCVEYFEEQSSLLSEKVEIGPARELEPLRERMRPCEIPSHYFLNKSSGFSFLSVETFSGDIEHNGVVDFENCVIFF